MFVALSFSLRRRPVASHIVNVRSRGRVCNCVATTAELVYRELDQIRCRWFVLASKTTSLQLRPSVKGQGDIFKLMRIDSLNLRHDQC